MEILRDPEPQILFDPEVKNPQPLKTEVERRFRFTLLGGGQTTVIEHFKLWRLNPADKWQFHRERQDLRVTADVGEGLKRFTGIIKGTFTEQYAYAVLFLPGTPQAIADRVAATFRLLTFIKGVGTSCRGSDPDNFSALLDRSSKCCVCDRALRDHVSTLLGIGPDCAKQMGLAHGLATATKILQRRRELLGEMLVDENKTI